MKIYLHYSSGFSDSLFGWSAKIPFDSRGIIEASWFMPKNTKIQDKNWHHSLNEELFRFTFEKISSLPMNLNPEITIDDAPTRTIIISLNNITEERCQTVWLEEEMSNKEKEFEQVWLAWLPIIQEKLILMGAPKKYVKFC